MNIWHGGPGGRTAIVDHWSRRAAVRAALCLLLLVIAGCTPGSGDGAAQPTVSPTATAGTPGRALDRSREFLARIDVKVRGATQFDWSGEDVIQLVRVGWKGIQGGTNLVSGQVLFPVPLPSDPATRFRWGFDYLGDYDDVPASFAIPVEQPGRPPEPGKPRGKALFIWMKVKDPAAEAVQDVSEVHFLREFRELREPCMLELGADSSTGRLHCPAIADPEGTVLDIEVIWRETRSAGGAGAEAAQEP